MKRIKNGFTLVELLGVLIVLAIILTIALYSIGSILNSSEESLTEVQVSKAVEAAKVFYLKEGLDLENAQGYNNKVCVTVEYLSTNGYLDKEVISPETNQDLGGYILITNTNNKYTYEYETGTPSSCVTP